MKMKLNGWLIFGSEVCGCVVDMQPFHKTVTLVIYKLGPCFHMYAAVSTKVVHKKRKSVRDNAER